MISSRGVAGYIDSQTSQLLNETPDFRPAGRNLLRDLGAADDDRRVSHQQAHDQAETGIRLLRRWREGYGARGRAPANCAAFADVEIMRESRRNNNVELLLGGHHAHAHIHRLRRMCQQSDRNEVDPGLGIGAHIIQANPAGALDGNVAFGFLRF